LQSAIGEDRRAGQITAASRRETAHEVEGGGWREATRRRVAVARIMYSARHNNSEICMYAG